jgi:serine/threonine-protein kinase
VPGEEDRIYGGRYELQRGIARGGMADVFLARDRLLDRPVALKVLFPELSSDKSFVERFRREAQAAANLGHPNIVSVFDWGEEDDTYYIVMEHIDGRPLSQVIRSEGPLLGDRAADIAAGVAAALGAAHRAGVIHRDVKPSNVMIAPDGQVKVTDFGIARAISATEGLTQTGAVMGTATYFSPEQAQGHAVDPRSDIYSLGVVLYEMVTGQPPFAGENPVSVAYKHVREDPVPVRERNPDVSSALEQIIHKAMAKNPANRYQSADEMAQDLTRFRSGRTVAAEPLLAAPVAGIPTAAVEATVAQPPVGGTQMLPMGHAGGPPPRESRTGVYVGVLVALLALIALLIVLLLNVFDPSGEDSARAEVPSVIGLDVDQATAELEDAGFEVETVFEPNEEISENTVFGQDPEPGERVEEGGTVTITASSGGAPVTVPEVVGLSYDDAFDELDGLGLVVRRVDEPSDDRPVGEVLEQDPAPDQEVPRGTTVTLVTSSGPAAAEVPDVTGLSEGEAANQLGRAGFDTDRQDESSSDVPAGRVIRTEPAAGTQLARGEVVTMVISSGPAETTVPDVVGDDESSARAELESVGFRVRVVEQRLDPGSPDHGRVLDQDPEGGSDAPSGSTVTIVVGRSPVGGGSGD